MLKYSPTSNIDCNDWKLNFWCIIKGKMGASNIGDNNTTSRHISMSVLTNTCLLHISGTSPGQTNCLSCGGMLTTQQTWSSGLECRHCRPGCRKPTESVVWSWVSEATEDSLHSQQTIFYPEILPRRSSPHSQHDTVTLSLRRPPSLLPLRCLLYM